MIYTQINGKTAKSRHYVGETAKSIRKSELTSAKAIKHASFAMKTVLRSGKEPMRCNNIRTAFLGNRSFCGLDLSIGRRTEKHKPTFPTAERPVCVPYKRKPIRQNCRVAAPAASATVNIQKITKRAFDGRALHGLK